MQKEFFSNNVLFVKFIFCCQFLLTVFVSYLKAVDNSIPCFYNTAK